MHTLLIPHMIGNFWIDYLLSFRECVTAKHCPRNTINRHTEYGQRQDNHDEKHQKGAEDFSVLKEFHHVVSATTMTAKKVIPIITPKSVLSITPIRIKASHRRKIGRNKAIR